MDDLGSSSLTNLVGFCGRKAALQRTRLAHLVCTMQHVQQANEEQAFYGRDNARRPPVYSGQQTSGEQSQTHGTIIGGPADSMAEHTATGRSDLAPGPALMVCGSRGQSLYTHCLLYTSPSPRDQVRSRMPSSA